MHTTNQVREPNIKTARTCPSAHDESVSMSNKQNYQNLELWHQRMGHVAPKTLQCTRQVVAGIPPLPSGTPFFSCPFCDMAKLTKSSGRKQAERENFQIGTAFHMDLGFVSGPKNLQQVTTDGATPQQTIKTDRTGHVAYLLIIDAATKYIWAFLLKEKAPPLNLIDQFLSRHGQAMTHRLITTNPSGLLHCSNTFQSLVKARGYNTATRNIIPDMDPTGLEQPRYTVRTDNGGELAGSTKFGATIARHGYVLETTAPDASSMNGLAERPHRTIKERIRCLLYTAGLGPEFWGDALLHVVWLYNRTCHSSIEQTPYQAYTKRIPTLDHLLTFRCRLTPKKARNRTSALDPNSYSGIFLGYKGTTDNLCYWDIHAQQERHAKHLTHDELQYGANPNDRNPASQHLIEVMTGTPHTEHNTSSMLELTNKNIIDSGPKPLIVDTESIMEIIQGTPLPHNKTTPIPQTAAAAKVRASYHPLTREELITSLQTLDVTLNIFEPVTSETIPLQGAHPTLGLEVEEP